MMRPTKNSPAAVDAAGRGDDGFGSAREDSSSRAQSQLVAQLDSLDEYCCRKHWITILTATVRRRKGERHTVVIHQDDQLIAWATWWGRQNLWNIVLLPGGRRWYQYENLSEFLRIVSDELEADTTDELVKLWGAP